MKVLLCCSDVVSSAMAGPAIRYWELANQLSKKHDVILSTPNIPDIQSPNFEIYPLPKSPLREAIKRADVLISQILTHNIIWYAKKNGVKMILDAYDPMPLEHFEMFKSLPLSTRNKKNLHIVENFLLYFQAADAIICANERQRNLWMGLLLGLKKCTPEVYDADPTLKNLIDIVPFGLSEESPKRNGDGLRKKYGFKENDIVLLWGGGIWDWFDPLTLIHAVKELSKEGFPIRLVFMGIKHPNPNIPDMTMTVRAIQLAKELNLYDTHVFFNEGWVPYHNRQNFLLDADIAVSTHFSHLETQYAFRTRMLDYLWAGLPILATEGDSFADFIIKHQLGSVVPSENPQAISAAIKKMVTQPEVIKNMKQQISTVRSQFFWKNVSQPIEQMIDRFAKAPKNGSTWASIKFFFKASSSFAKLRVISRAMKNRAVAMLLRMKDNLLYE